MAIDESKLLPSFRPGLVQASGKRKAYSDQERASALTILSLNKGNLSETSRQLGIPVSTLIDWRDRNGGVNVNQFSEVREQVNADFAKYLDAIAFQCAGLLPAKLPKASVKDLNTVLDTSIKNSLLLRGQPTQITATTDNSKDLLLAVQAIVNTEQISQYEAAIKLADQLADVPELANQLRAWAEGELRNK